MTTTDTTPCAKKIALCFAIAALSIPGVAHAGTVTVHAGSVVDVAEATFFAFDRKSIPFRRNLHLTMVAPEKHPTPILPRGSAGSFDELRAEYYGSVIRIDGKFCMWYVGYGFADAKVQSLDGVVAGIGYAESMDGVHWVKPRLGLVPFRGSTENNMVRIDPEDFTRTHPDRNLHVLHEPDDPDPSRRFKMMLFAPYGGDRWSGRWTMIPLVSSDGFRWKYAFPIRLTQVPGSVKQRIDAASIPLPVEHLEGGSLIKLGKNYYLNGQQLNGADGKLTGRIMTTFWSPDFTHWHAEKAVSFIRRGYDRSKPLGEGNEVHEGAALWNRGNVMVGIYGRWQGAKAWRDLRLDLGLVTSTDAIHFVEPDPDFVFARRGERGSWDSGGLLQGQGFENVGDKTLIWYGSWNLAVSDNDLDRELDMLTSHGEVGLLTMRRDGFGHLTILDPKQAKKNETFESGMGSFVTAPFVVRQNPARVFLNVDNTEAGGVEVELLDHRGAPVPGYSLSEFQSLQKSGVRQPATWKNQKEMPAGGPYRLRVAIKYGATSPRFYAAYVDARAEK